MPGLWCNLVDLWVLAGPIVKWTTACLAQGFAAPHRHELSSLIGNGTASEWMALGLRSDLPCWILTAKPAVVGVGDTGFFRNSPCWLVTCRFYCYGFLLPFEVSSRQEQALFSFAGLDTKSDSRGWHSRHAKLCLGAGVRGGGQSIPFF